MRGENDNFSNCFIYIRRLRFVRRRRRRGDKWLCTSARDGYVIIEICFIYYARWGASFIYSSELNIVFVRLYTFPKKNLIWVRDICIIYGDPWWKKMPFWVNDGIRRIFQSDYFASIFFVPSYPTRTIRACKRIFIYKHDDDDDVEPPFI